MARELIQAAVGSGAWLWNAREVLEITVRTYQRWGTRPRGGDRRREVKHRPENRMCEEDKARMIAIATSVRFREFAPAQFVPILVEEGVYVASESSSG